MKLATMKSSGPDGKLVVVSSDGGRYMPASQPNLQRLLENWDVEIAACMELGQRLDEGQGEQMDHGTLLAPLPRAWQWLDGSAFVTHGMLMERAYNLDPIPMDPPLMYQGLSHQFLAPGEDFMLRDESFGLDFEGEFGVITDDVPVGVSAQDALSHIKLVVVINDWSHRAFVQSELKRGFGWLHAKPTSSLAPICVTPDELGAGWVDGRVCLPLEVTYNGNLFGRPNGREMLFGFHELIAYAAQTRALPAGTIIGSGTVSNEDFRACGSACIAERRAIEMIDHGKPVTPFMAPGDTIRMEAFNAAGVSLFGAINQSVVASV